MFFIILEYVTDIFNHLFVTHVLEGLFTGERQYFPKGDSKRPHIRLGGELALFWVGMKESKRKIVKAS